MRAWGSPGASLADRSVAELVALARLLADRPSAQDTEVVRAVQAVPWRVPWARALSTLQDLEAAGVRRGLRAAGSPF